MSAFRGHESEFRGREISCRSREVPVKGVKMLVEAVRVFTGSVIGLDIARPAVKVLIYVEAIKVRVDDG